MLLPFLSASSWPGKHASSSCSKPCLKATHPTSSCNHSEHTTSPACFVLVRVLNILCILIGSCLLWHPCLKDAQLFATHTNSPANVELCCQGIIHSFQQPLLESHAAVCRTQTLLRLCSFVVCRLFVDSFQLPVLVGRAATCCTQKLLLVQMPELLFVFVNGKWVNNTNACTASPHCLTCFNTKMHRKKLFMQSRPFPTPAYFHLLLLDSRMATLKSGLKNDEPALLGCSRAWDLLRVTCLGCTHLF